MIIKNFIVFEGIDGAGTTSQINLLKEKIPQEKLFTTAEPTSGETGLFLRRMLRGEFHVEESTAAYLFAADRCEHIYGKDGIISQTKQGKIIISDRYLFSSLAYQSQSCRDNLPEFLNSLFPLPEILFYFKIDAETALERVSKRGKKLEIYERLDFQKKTALSYQKIMDRYKNDKEMTLITVDASKPIEEISEFVWNTIKNLPILKG